MNHTTRDEDNIVDACEAFGGKAEECAQIVQRLDDLITEMHFEIYELKNEIGELYDEIQGWQQGLADAKEDQS